MRRSEAVREKQTDNFFLIISNVISWQHGRILPPATHDKLRVVPPIRQITPKNKKIKKLKFIDKAKQGVYIGVFKGAEFKNGFYFVIKPILHCVLA